MKNMNKSKLMGLMAAGALLACQATQANTIVSPSAIPTIPSGGSVNGTSVLGLTEPVSNPTAYSYADSDLGVDWTVSYSGGIYEYSYDLLNPSTQQDPNNVENFAVQVNPALVLTVLNGGSLGANSVTWTVNVPHSGSSGYLSYLSLYPPSYLNATANDSTAPAPWSGQNPHGTPVPSPEIPDGGTTVALLGGALIGLQMLTKKFRI